MRNFHIGDILSVVTDRLVSPRQTEGIRDILGYMVGGELYEYQYNSAIKECREYLLEQYPQFKTVTPPEVDQNNYLDWLEKQAKLYGETLPVKPLPLANN